MNLRRFDITGRLTGSFTKGHERSVRAKKNIALAFILNAVDVFAGFLRVPLMLVYLDSARYGVWLTVSSIIGWFLLFDVGLASGLRNRLGEAIADNDSEQAKTYISTTYALLAGLSVFVFIVFIAAHPFLDWAGILNTGEGLAAELNLLIPVMFCYFVLHQVLKLIGTVLAADQKPAWGNALNTLSSVFFIVAVYVLTKTTSGSLVPLGIATLIIPVAIHLIATVLLFSGRYKRYAPSLRSIDFSRAGDLVGLSLRYFVIQISWIIIFTTDNMIITRLYGPAEVTPYSIAQKLFSVVTIAFTVLLTPVWAASTDAFKKGDLDWVSNALKKILMIWGVSIAGVLALLAVSGPLYRFWVGDEVSIPFVLSAAMALFVIISSWNRIFSFFLNGTGKIKVQFYCSIVGGVINIPLSVLFARTLGLGSTGVILATSVSIFAATVLMPVQYGKIMGNTARGVWNE